MGEELLAVSFPFWPRVIIGMRFGSERWTRQQSSGCRGNDIAREDASNQIWGYRDGTKQWTSVGLQGLSASRLAAVPR